MVKLEYHVVPDYPQEPHCALVLLLDASGSMDPTKISVVNEKLRVLKNVIKSDDLLSKKVDLAVVTFADDVQVIHEFSSIDKFDPPTIVGNGQACMGEAILKAIGMVETRKEQYKYNGIDHYRPLILLLTDGNATDMEPGNEKWKQVQNLLHEGEKHKKFIFLAAVVEAGNRVMLTGLVSPVRPPIELKELEFDKLFRRF